MCVYIVM